MKTTPQVQPPNVAAPGKSPPDPASKTQQIDSLKELMARATEKAVLFEIEAGCDSQVFIAGTFNGWNPTSHPLKYHPEDDVFRAVLLLESGTYEYKFVVNGRWCVDAKCPDSVLNDNGTLNSVIHVRCHSPG